MDSKISKKQLAYIVGILVVGVVLALLIMLTKPRAPAAEAGESEHAEEQVASRRKAKLVKTPMKPKRRIPTASSSRTLKSQLQESRY